jgi:hypothetical protein
MEFNELLELIPYGYGVPTCVCCDEDDDIPPVILP